MMLEFLLPFLIAIFLLTVTPGLDTALVIRTAAVHKVKGFASGARNHLWLFCLGSFGGLWRGSIAGKLRVSIQYHEMGRRNLFAVVGLWIVV